MEKYYELYIFLGANLKIRTDSNMAVYKGNAPFSVAWQATILTFERIDHIILKFKIYLFGAPEKESNLRHAG